MTQCDTLLTYCGNGSFLVRSQLGFELREPVQEVEEERSIMLSPSMSISGWRSFLVQHAVNH
jgi:hypothetical protein